MAKKEKALRRLLSAPKDLTWTEVVSLMTAFPYELKTAGGSGRKFVHRQTGSTLFIHEPHPHKILKPYQVRDVIHHLRKDGYL